MSQRSLGRVLRGPLRLGLSAAAGLSLLFLAAGPAAAHVSVRAESATVGSFTALTFRVPNESDTAGTTKLRVELPADAPLLYVSTKPVPGWTATVTKAKLPKPVESFGTTITEAVRTVTWTADAAPARIAPGQYQEFALSAGPLPGPGALVMPAQQSYSDGAVVAWDQPTPASGEQPEHPAPTIQVVAAPADGRSDAAAAAGAGSDPAARVLGGAGLAVGVAGLTVAAVAVRRAAAGSARR